MPFAEDHPFDQPSYQPNDYPEPRQLLTTPSPRMSQVSETSYPVTPSVGSDASRELDSRELHRLLMAIKYVPKNSPTQMLLPPIYKWQPSERLMQEMTNFIVELRENGPTGLVRLFRSNDNDQFEHDSWRMFRATNKVFAVQLPSQMVLIKLTGQTTFVQMNPYPITMSIWTLELHDGQQKLGLRGLFGVQDKMSHSLRDSEVTTGYSVKRQIFDEREPGPVLLRVTPTHTGLRGGTSLH